MKPIIVGAVAFVIGVAGGTFLSPARRAEPAPAADEHAVPVDSTPTENTVALPVAPVVEADTGVAAPEPVAATTERERAAMVHTVSSMKPTDAAPMLARLNDSDAVAVLKALPITKASEILDAMASDQAARLSRELLLAGAVP